MPHSMMGIAPSSGGKGLGAVCAACLPSLDASSHTNRRPFSSSVGKDVTQERGLAQADAAAARGSEVSCRVREGGSGKGGEGERGSFGTRP